MTDVEERRQSARRRASRPTAHSSALDSLRAAREGRENRVEQYEVSIMVKLCVFPAYLKHVCLGQCSRTIQNVYPFSPWSRCFDPSSRTDDRFRRALSASTAAASAIILTNPSFYSRRRYLWPTPSNPQSDGVECVWSGSRLNSVYNRKLVPSFPAVLHKLKILYLVFEASWSTYSLSPGALSKCLWIFSSFPLYVPCPCEN